MAPREVRRCFGGTLEVIHDETERISRHQHRGGVNDVLARGSLVDVVGEVCPGCVAQRIDEGNHRVAACRGRRRESGNIEPYRVAEKPDRRPGLGRNDTGRRVRECERALDLKHGV